MVIGDDLIKFYHYDKVEHNCDDNLRDFIKHDPSDSKETFQFLVPMLQGFPHD